MKKTQEKGVRRRTVYDGLDIGIRGLTVVILLGLLLLTAVMAWGYWLGNREEIGEVDAAVSRSPSDSGKIGKINQKLIDNLEKPYYNKGIAVA